MRIILDDHELDAVHSGAADALEAVRGICEAQGRIITDVFLDDRHLDGADFEHLAAENRGGQVLRCVSTDPCNLVCETLECVSEALDEIGAVHESIAAQFQGGNMAEGLSELKDALALWNSVRQGVDQGCMLVNIDLEQMRTETAEIDEALNSLAGRLGDIRNAVSNQDWSSVADTVGYEMEPVVGHWQTLVRVLTERVESMRDAGGAA